MSDLKRTKFSSFPDDWNEVKVSDAFHMQLGKMLSRASKVGRNPKPYLANRNVQWDRLDLSDLETMDFTEDEQAKYQLQPGDLLVCEGGEVGRTAMWRGKSSGIFFQKAIHRLRSKSGVADPAYVLRFFRIAAINGWFCDYVSQTSIAHLTREKLSDFPLILPKPAEQREIAKVLTTVDCLIDKAEGLIEKYKSIKQGLMHDLLTRGVDEHGHLRAEATTSGSKPEREDWPVLPNGWRRACLGECLKRIEGGKSPECPDIPASPGQWAVLKVGAIQPDGFRSEENKVVTNASFIKPAYEVQDGDFLISRSNTYELVGLVCLVRQPQPHLMLCDKTLRLVFNEDVLRRRFAIWQLQHPFARRQIEANANGTSGGMKNISQDSIRGLRVVIPPLHEQDAIAERLEALLGRLKTEEAQLRKLRQVKAGLMQDLLTGKVRVKTPTQEVAVHA